MASFAALLGVSALAAGAEPRTVLVSGDSTSNITGLAFSPDGRTLASSSLNGGATLWDIARARPRATLKKDADGSVHAVAISPDGSTVATAHVFVQSHHLPGLIRLWDAASGEHRRTIEATDGRPRRPVFSRDSRRVAMVDNRRQARIWEIADGKMAAEVRLPEGFHMAAFAPDLATLAATDDRSVRLIEVATGREVATLTGLPNRPLDLAFSPDGKSLACGVGTPMRLSNMPTNPAESLVKVWDLSAESPRERVTLTGVGPHGGPLAFSPDGGLILTSKARGGTGAILWDVATGERRAALEGGLEGGPVAFAPDGKVLAAARGAGGITFWDAETWAGPARR